MGSRGDEGLACIVVNLQSLILRPYSAQLSNLDKFYILGVMLSETKHPFELYRGSSLRSE